LLPTLDTLTDYLRTPPGTVTDLLSQLLICPHCSADAHSRRNNWSCINGHSYDQTRARAYLNLLLVQHKETAGQPGDTPANARLPPGVIWKAGIYQR